MHNITLKGLRSSLFDLKVRVVCNREVIDTEDSKEGKEKTLRQANIKLALQYCLILCNLNKHLHFKQLYLLVDVVSNENIYSLISAGFTYFPIIDLSEMLSCVAKDVAAWLFYMFVILKERFC